MSISDNYAPDISTGNGSTTIFTGSWSPIAASYMRVYLELISTGARTLVDQGGSANQYTLAFTSSGYTVTMGTAPSSLYRLIRSREVAIDQSTPYTTARGWQGATIENSFDKLTAITQDQQDAIDRAPKFEVGSSQTDVTIGLLVDDEILRFNETDNTIESSGYTVDDLGDSVTDASASAAAAASSASAASTSASAASTSAAAAAASVAALSATSTTSVAIATGAKSFTTQSGKLFVAGQLLQIASAANSSNFMHGAVTSYSGTSLVMNITDIGGSGTLANWNISISGTQGPTGATGPGGAGSGDFSSNTASSVDSEIVLFSSTSGKLGKRATGTGYVKVTSGVMGTPAATVPLTDLATQAANTILAEATGSTAAPTAVAIAANKFPARASTGNIAAKDITDFALTLLDDADAATARTTLGVSASGGLVYLGTQTASNSATLSFTSLISATYDDYVVMVDNIVPQTTGSGEAFEMVTSTNNGSTYSNSASDYEGGLTTNSAQLTNTTGNDTAKGISGEIKLFNLNSTTKRKYFISSMAYENAATAFVGLTAYNARTSTADIDAIRFKMNSGNMVSGVIRLYGVAKA